MAPCTSVVNETHEGWKPFCLLPLFLSFLLPFLCPQLPSDFIVTLFCLYSGGIKCNCGQIHWRECSFDPRDVQLCSWPPAMYHLYGWDWCYRCVCLGLLWDQSQISTLIMLFLYVYTLILHYN